MSSSSPQTQPSSVFGYLDSLTEPARLRRYPVFLLALTVALYAGTLSRSSNLIEPNGKIVGRDFLAFYTAGDLLNQGRMDDLYDQAAHSAYQQDFMRDINPNWQGTYPYRNPPHYAWAMSWLTGLGFGRSLLIWTLLSLLAFAVTASIWRHWLPPADTGIVLLLAVCVPPWFQALAGGQNTFFSLLILTGFCALLMRGRDGWAGLVLSALSYKFYLLVLPAGLLLVKGRWRAVGGLLLGGVLTLLLTAAVMGPEVLSDYLNFAPSQAALMEEGGFDIHKQHCWYGFFRLLGGDWMSLGSVSMLAITASAVTLVLLIPVWRGPWRYGESDFSLKLAALMVATLVTSPHLLHYDMLLAVLPAVLWLRTDRSMDLPGLGHTMRPLLVLGFCWLAVAEPVARITHVQLTPLLMVGWIASVAVIAFGLRATHLPPQPLVGSRQ
ncbi:MAG: glycosyltransferase family 87 protein [Phycisphaerae bacterium]